MPSAFFNFESICAVTILAIMQARAQFMQYILSKGDLYALYIIRLGIIEDPDKKLSASFLPQYLSKRLVKETDNGAGPAGFDPASDRLLILAYF